MPGNGNQVPSGGDQVEQWRNGSGESAVSGTRTTCRC